MKVEKRRDIVCRDHGAGAACSQDVARLPRKRGDIARLRRWEQGNWYEACGCNAEEGPNEAANFRDHQRYAVARGQPAGTEGAPDVQRLGEKLPIRNE
jgi:hypothetical protein